jgi:hypothetical protein
MMLGKEDGMRVEEWRNVQIKNESGADIDEKRE